MLEVGDSIPKRNEMRNLFEHTSASWVKYSGYEYKGKNGTLYLLPTEDAVPMHYDPMKDAEALVLKAMEIGLLYFKKKPDHEVQTAIRVFACEYELLELMTALPTTVKFIEYEKVYLPKNEFIRAESMDTQEYLDFFYPFQKPDFRKIGIESEWNEDDKTMMALILTYQNYPQSAVMSFMVEFAKAVDTTQPMLSKWISRETDDGRITPQLESRHAPNTAQIILASAYLSMPINEMIDRAVKGEEENPLIPPKMLNRLRQVSKELHENGAAETSKKDEERTVDYLKKIRRTSNARFIGFFLQNEKIEHLIIETYEPFRTGSVPMTARIIGKPVIHIEEMRFPLPVMIIYISIFGRKMGKMIVV